jgi:hypothetical protein
LSITSRTAAPTDSPRGPSARLEPRVTGRCRARSEAAASNHTSVACASTGQLGRSQSQARKSPTEARRVRSPRRLLLSSRDTQLRVWRRLAEGPRPEDRPRSNRPAGGHDRHATPRPACSLARVRFEGTAADRPAVPRSPQGRSRRHGPTEAEAPARPRGHHNRTAKAARPRAARAVRVPSDAALRSRPAPHSQRPRAREERHRRRPRTGLSSDRGTCSPIRRRCGGTRGRPAAQHPLRPLRRYARIVRVKLARDPLDDDVVTRTNPRKERRDVVRFPERVQRAALRPPLPPRHEVALVLSPTGAAETQ